MENNVEKESLSGQGELMDSSYNARVTQGGPSNDGHMPEINANVLTAAEYDAYDDANIGEDYKQISRQTLDRQMQERANAILGEPEPEPEPVDKPSNWAEWVAQEAGEAGKAIMSGVVDGTDEIIQLSSDMRQWFVDKGIKDPLTMMRVPITEGDVLPEVETSGEVGDNLIKGIAQFAMGWAGPGAAVKGVKVLGNGYRKTNDVVNSMTRGAVADFSAFDAHEARISDLINNEAPELQSFVTEYLAADPNDTEVEGRLKNAVEGSIVGGSAEVIMKGLKLWRQARRVKGERDRIDKILVDGGADSKTMKDAKADLDSIVAQETPLVRIQTELGGDTDLIEVMDLTDEQLKAFGGDIGELPNKAVNINLNRLNTPDDVKEAIVRTAEMLRGEIDEARRGEISLDETVRLADDMNMSVDQLLRRHSGQAFNAEQAVASRKILANSAQRVKNIANMIAEGGDSTTNMVLFRQALSIHAGIQKQVSGMTAEAGRALSSFRVRPTSGDINLDTKAVQDALEGGGGSDHIRDIAKKIMSADPRVINSVSRELSKPGLRDMVLEVWLNGLLSSPATHAVNILSNTLTSAWMIPERFVAGGIRKARGGKGVRAGEGMEMLYGYLHGTRDGLAAAWETFKTGEPSDPITKMELENHRSVTAENVGIQNQSIAKGFDLAADWSIRLPGKMLMATDELFKAIGYRSELQARAYRTVMDEGLEGEAAARRMTDLITNTPPDLKAASIDAGRYITFQKELGETGKSIQTFANTAELGGIPVGKLILPFVRTPVNIAKFAGERTPLGFLSTSIRKDIAKGGADADLAIARIGLGTSIMGATAAMVQEGQITGTGPLNPAVNKMWRESGKQPYSIIVNGTYYSYSRLDPFGMLLGITADATEIMQYASASEDAEAANAAAAVGLAIVNNLMSKTYLSGVSDLFNTLAYSTTNPEGSNSAMENYLIRMGASFTPMTSLVGSIERQVDPTLREAQGIVEYVRSKTPGLSDTLPPRRNIFGEPILLEGGLGWDMASPVYVSTDKQDPVYDDIIDNEIALNRPRRQLSGIELSTEQYDRYNQLIAGREEDGKPTPGLKRTLYEEMQKQMKTKEYKNATDGPEGGKALVVKTVFQTYKEYAKKQMLNEYNDLNEKSMDLDLKKALELGG